MRRQEPSRLPTKERKIHKFYFRFGGERLMCKFNIHKASPEFRVLEKKLCSKEKEIEDLKFKITSRNSRLEHMEMKLNEIGRVFPLKIGDFENKKKRCYS